jgi:ATP-dependent helicase/nuclease subunit A
MAHSPQSLTPQQQAALSTLDVPIALSAGAGCGKTFVLTKRFLSYLQPVELETDPLGGIVAITFTDRAAREMRDRIRNECHSELKRCSTQDISYWMRVIRSLDSARISTIHSFCGGLLRAHAIDSGLDPRFSLLEQTLGDAFLRNVVDTAVRELLARQNEDCMQLVLHYGLERTVELLRTLMPGRFQANLQSLSSQTAESLTADWYRRWHEEFIPQMLGDLAESNAAQSLLSLLAENEPSHSVMQLRRETLLTHLPFLNKEDDPLAALTAIREATKIQGGGGKPAWESVEIYETVSNSLKLVRKQIDSLIKDLEIDDSHVQTAAQFGLMASRLIVHIDERYESRKQELACLDFDDLLLKTRNLLRDSESIRSRAAAGIDFLMIDEFQDTDPVQSEIVRHLCGGDLLTGKLFVVGDVKQSIYRFRRADPKVFSSLRDEIPQQGRLPLTTNFRSQPEILKFINALFAQSMGDTYERLVPFDTKQHSPPPAVEFLFASDRGSTEDEKPKDSATDRRRREADWIARRLRMLLDDDTPRIWEKNSETDKSRLRPVQQGDIAILFRTLSNVALYEEALRKYGIEYYLIGSRAFYAQQEVYDLVNLCRYLIDADDAVSLVGILRSPFFSLSDDTLFALTDNWGSLAEAVTNLITESVPEHLCEEQQRQAVFAASLLAELRSHKDRLPLIQLLNRAIEQTGYDAALLGEFLGRRKVANLRKLLDKARQFDRTGMFTLWEFVERLQQSVKEQSDEELAATQSEAGNVVRLMTVHQSKGLEFPVVIVADMDWAKRGGSSSPHFHPQLGPLLPLPAKHGETPKNIGQIMHGYSDSREDEKETVRLFYVAATRAADYLILSSGLGADRRVKSPWLKLLSSRFDLDTGLPAVDPYLGRISLGDIPPQDIPEIRVHHTPPEIPDGASYASKSEELPLAQFRESVKTVTADSLPELLTPIEPQPSSFRQCSVSVIREVDEKLRETATDSDNDQSRNDFTIEGDRHQSEGDHSDSATDLGTLVHDVLERIDFQNPQPIESLLETCLAGMQSDSLDALRDAALKRLLPFLESPVFTELQSAQECFREIDFLLKWPLENAPEESADTVTITGQIDCLVHTVDDRWKLFDFKTGRVPQKQFASILKKYEIQLLLYSLACREFLDRFPDSVELVLLQSDAVDCVAFEITDDVLSNLSKRIETAIRQLRLCGQTK